MGIKQYTYPSVLSRNDNERFEGFWNHSWESGVVPEGFSPSLHLRSLDNVLQTRSQLHDWLFCSIILDQGDKIFARVSPMPVSVNTSNTVDIFRIVQPDGFVQSVSTCRIDVQEVHPKHGFVTKWVLHNDSFRIQLSYDSKVVQPTSFFAPYKSFHTDIQCLETPIKVGGQYKNQHVQGFGFVYMTPRSSEAENTQAVLSLLQPDNFIIQKQSPVGLSRKTVVYSHLVWAIPLVIIFCICLLGMFMIIFKRNTLLMNDQKFRLSSEVKKDILIN
jgi:hypothetical protein